MLKKLAACVREYKKESLLAPLFVSLEVILEVIIPFLMAFLIDKGVEKGDMGYILKMGALIIVCCVASLACGALSGKYAARASTGFAKNLRHDMYHNVQNFSFSNIDRFSTSSLVTRMTTDVSNVQNAYMMIVRVAVRSPMMMICAMIMSFNISVKLALVFVCVLPFLATVIFGIAIKAHPTFERVFKTYDKLNNVVGENLSGIRVVKSFVREEYEKEKFGNISEDIYKDFTKAEKLLAFNNPAMMTASYTCMLLVCWLGAKMIVNSGATTMTTGLLTSFISYSMQILMSLMMFSMVFVMIIIARSSAERITEVLSEVSDLQNPENPIYEVADGSVKFEDVNFSYSKKKKKPAISNVNLDIKSGETIGIIGGTGSSKSTLVSLIPRLYDVTDGRVLVGGRDVREYDVQTLRDSVAMVLQKNVLFSGTIKENLRWGNKDATDEEIKHACVLACADEFVSAFPDGYDTYIEQGGSNVSGGQKQRLCIARALLKKPKILILDDSTSAVDTKTDAIIRKAFKEEIPDTTKFIIAQRISSVQDADRTIVLEGGRVVDFGSHEELLSRCDIYREVYESQVKGDEENGK